MSVLLMEGFEGLGTTTGVGAAAAFNTRFRRRGYFGSYPSANFGHLEAGYNAIGYAYSWGDPFATGEWNYMFPENQYGKTLIVGLRFKTSSSTQSEDRTFISFHSVSVLGTFENSQFQLNIVDQNKFRIKLGAVVTLATSGVVLTTDTWYHLEWKVLIHPSAGSYDLKLDGSTILSASGIDTQDSDGNVGFIRFSSQRSGTPETQFLLDDLYVLNSDGSINNDFLGINTVIRAYYPDADASPNDFTPSVGVDHYALVDEAEEDFADYLDGVTATNREAFSMQPVGSGSFKAVMQEALVKVNSAGVRNIRNVVESGATTSNGASVGISDADDPVAVRRILETDPDTGLFWTESGINAAEFGMEVQT
jgi:hypothetical protein